MRSASIQYMRVVSMIIIVAYHCLCFYGVWYKDVVYDYIDVYRNVCILALNAFVLISGLLYSMSYRLGRYKGKRQTITNKMQRLLIPYIIWGVLAILLFTSDHYFRDFLCGVQHLWFLEMMAIMFCLAEMLRVNAVKINTLCASIAVFVILEAVLSKVHIQEYNYLGWKYVVKYAPAFLCGIIADRLSCRNVSLVWEYTIFVLSSIGLLIVTFSSSLPYGMFYMNIPVLFWLVTLYLLLNKVIVRGRQLKSPMLISLDRNSMGIYIIHHILIWAVIFYVPECVLWMQTHFIIAPIIMFLVVFPLAWWLASILSKNMYTSFVFTGKLVRKL